MRQVAIDSETWKMEAGIAAPRLVCVATAERTYELWPNPSSESCIKPLLFDRKDGIEVYRYLLAEAAAVRAILIFTNAPFDLAVACAADDSLLELVFAAYRVGGIRDVKERQKLIDLADGKMKFARDEDGVFRRSVYTLAALAKRHTGRELDKGADSWRLRYSELDGIPVGEWPDDARRYVLLDAVATLEVAEEQDKTFGSPVVYRDETGLAHVVNEEDQARAHWALQLQSVWGIRSDAETVARLRATLEAERDVHRKKIAELEAGLPVEERVYKSKSYKKGAKAGIVEISRNMRAIQTRVLGGFRRQGLTPPLTEGGHKLVNKGEFPAELEEQLRYIQTSKEVMLDAEDPVLEVLADSVYGDKLLSSYLPKLEHGTTRPMNPAYNALLESGRTSSPEPKEGGINPQVLPRKPGVRECLVPRPHKVLCASDYSQLELCTLAQVMIDLFGKSTMGDAINAGKDLHLLLASTELGLTYEETLRRYEAGDVEVKEARQRAKPGNFGFGGGMGHIAYLDFTKASMDRASWKKLWGKFTPKEREAKALGQRAAYLRTYSDMPRYFEYIADLLGPAGEGPVKQHRSNRVRGGCRFCQGANSLFQGLAADGAKLALWRVAEECYVKKDSPLYGSRPIAFVHDEIVMETDLEHAHEAAMRLSQVMVEAMKVFVPDVKIEAKPVLMTCWSKDAKAVFVDGRLVPWSPK